MRNFSLLLAAIFFTALTISCSDSSTSPDRETPPPPEAGSYTLKAAFPDLTFESPTDLQHPSDGSNRLFVVEREGIIRVFQNDSTASESDVFLDISDRIVTTGEGGLLAMAFHPDYETNGYFYVNYTTGNPFRTVICRFQVSEDDANRAVESSETLILPISQPQSNHNGGQIQFGPDGYLYIATGDGGGAGDPDGNAQNRGNLLGNILRIDVDGSGGETDNYGIPSDNPFVGNEEGFREEIFAYGLRNPYRFSFDAETGDLWAGDVGQNRFEEIDIIENGNNYGWDITEGDACFEPMQDCDRDGLTDPVFTYQQDNNQSITGGFVYRGTSLPGLTGYYIYADYISGSVWALDASEPENPDNVELLGSALSIVGFGTDAENELYICAFDGTIYELAEAE